MDTDVVKAFNAELTSIYESKVPLGKNKIQDISKAALKAKSYYKHVVFSLEKFLGKCKPEYKIPCLYVIDSIIRASKHQFKDKDVYAARFLKNFSKTLSDLLQCAPTERPRVVRTLNLWAANGVFSDDAMAPFKQQCQEAGLETDLEKVEKQVKGGRADMSIYGGSYAKKDKDRRKSHQTPSKFEATTPPGPPPASALLETTVNGGFGKKEEPSTEVPDGGISEQHLLSIIQQAGCDFNGSFSSDLTLLRKAHDLVCKRLHMEEEMRKERKKANIKNILKSDFNYSDDEDSGDEGAKQETEEEVLMPMTIEERLTLSDQLIREPTVADALKMIHQERMMQLNQVALQAQQQNSVQVPPPHTAADLTAIQNAMSAVPSTIASGLPPRIPGLPPGFQLPPGMPHLASIPGLAGLQLPPNIPPPSGGNNQNALLAGLIGNPLNIPSLNQLVRQPGLMNLLGNGLPPDPELLKKQQAEILQQVYLGQPIGVPPPALPHGLGGPPPQLPPGFVPSGVPPPLPTNQSNEEDMRGGTQMGEDRDKRKDRKRSRSRDRGDHKRSRRSRSRDRKSEKVDRERRKLGLPAVTPGVAIIASKTLWFGRLPANCSDKEIKAAITSAGDVVRVNIIQSKACAYVTMDTRKNAYEVVNKLARDLKVKDKIVKVSWAVGNGLKDEKYKSMFDSEKGVTMINWQMLPENLDQLCDGGHLDIESLPPEKQTCYSENGTIAIVPPNDDGSMDIASPSPNPPLNTGLNSTVAPNMFMMQHGTNPALLHGIQPQHGLPPHMPPRMPPPMASGHQIPVLGGMPPKIPPGTSHFAPQHHLPPGAAPPMGSCGQPGVAPQKSAFDLAPPHFQGGRGGFRGGGFRGGRGGFGSREGRWGGDRPPRDGPPQDFRRDGRDFRGGPPGNFRGRGGGDFRGGPTGDFHRDGPPRGGEFHDRRGGGWERDEGRGGGRRNDDFGRRDSNGGRRDERRRSRWGDRTEESWDRDGDRRDRRDEGRRDRDRRRSERGSPPHGEDQYTREREPPPMEQGQHSEPPPPGTDFTTEDAVVTSTTADIEPPAFQKNDHEENNGFQPPGEECTAPAVTTLAENLPEHIPEATSEC